MRITAKVDYAVRAAIELARAADDGARPVPVKGQQLAAAQGIPVKFLESILADVRGVRPDQLHFGDDLEALQRMWIAVRANLRAVLERVTLDHLRSGLLPPEIDALAKPPEAWTVR